MANPWSEAHCATEADRVDNHQRTIGLAHIQRNDAIDSQAERRYWPVNFVESIAGKASYDELARLLREVWSVNELFVGQKTREVEAYLFLSGEATSHWHQWRGWINRYVNIRLKNPNPRDSGDPARTFVRLSRELERLIGELHMLPHSINYILLGTPFRYARWLLFEGTWRSYVLTDDNRVEITHQAIRSFNSEFGAHCLWNDGWGVFRLTELLETLDLDLAGSDYAALHLTDQNAFRSINESFQFIQECRPLLVNIEPTSIRFPLPGGQLLAWEWIIGESLAYVSHAVDEKELHEANLTQKCRLHVGVNEEGVLVDPYKPWITAMGHKKLPHFGPLQLNAWVLESFCSLLTRAYEAIDLDKMRASARAKSPSEEIEDAELAIASSDLDQMDKDPRDASEKAAEPKTVSLKIRPMRIRVLLRLLQQHFGCEIRQGKGSEITAFRQGARKFTFGAHGANPLVPHVKVSMALRSLGIGRHDWVSLVYA